MKVTSTDARTVTVEREIAFPPEKVWRALTQPELIQDWLMKNDFKPDIGHRFVLHAGWGEITCEVLEVEQHKRLAYTWEGRGLQSVVTWTLTPTRTGTRLSMHQTGFQPDQERAYRGATAGWPRFFESLEALLARLN